MSRDERLEATAAALAFPRRAGSGGSRRIVRQLADRLRDLGFEVAVEAFSYDLRPVERALRWALLAAAVLVALAASLAAARPWWSATLLAAGFGLGGVLMGWAPWLETLYRRSGATRTANVVGRRAATAPRCRIVLVAHHDSKSQSLSLPVRMAATGCAVVGGLVTAGAVGAALVLGHLPVPSWVAWVAGAVGCVSLIALASMTSGNESPGGVDNAGSLAIVLALAEMADELADDVELVVLFTGAEEDHMVGAMRWLDRHADELRRPPTHCLNLDGAGAPGRTVLITRFGLGRRFAPHVERAAVAAARELGEPVRRIVMAPAVGIDAIPFAHRRIECLTVSSGSLGPATASVHSANDVAEHLDGATMRRVLDLARAVIRRLAGS